MQGQFRVQAPGNCQIFRNLLVLRCSVFSCANVVPRNRRSLKQRRSSGEYIRQQPLIAGILMRREADANTTFLYEVHMRRRNSMSVPFVEIGSRTRTRWSDTRTRCMYDGIHGHVPPCLGMIGPSTTQPTVPARRIPAGTAEKNSLVLAKGQDQAPCPAAWCQSMPRTRTGMSAFDIFRKCTSSANATRPRSFIEPITSDNT